jgi:hypothetical protein
VIFRDLHKTKGIFLLYHCNRKHAMNPQKIIPQEEIDIRRNPIKTFNFANRESRHG